MDYNIRYRHKVVLKRFTDEHSRDDAVQPAINPESQQKTTHIRQFLMMAQYRKRQIIERMLMD